MVEELNIHQVLYDPIVKYMEGLGNGNELLGPYHKDQFLYYNSIPLGILVLFLIQHEEIWYLWDHFLGWLHWKS